MDDSKNAQRLSRRACRLAGEVVRRYLSVESVMKSWLVAKGVDFRLCTWLFRILKLVMVGLVLYVFFWVVSVIVGIWILQHIGSLTDSSPSESEAGFNTDDLFPDPYSQDNIYDPVFNHDES